ncbi:MAG: hypothetical protein JWM23_699 [Microbacteriaceae bacterium]|nr:hypothetical protein [Microbacteriaceae bacterium]
MAKKKDDPGMTCKLVATDFWECTDENGRIWWCDSDSCQQKPLVVGPLETIRVHLDLRVMKDKDTGAVLVVLPLVTGSEDGNIARDCTYEGRSYSKGAVIPMADGKNHTCSGDDDGSWTNA